MGLMKQKLLGAWGELKGRVKRSVGAAKGDNELELEGRGQEAVGHVRRRGAEALDRGIGKAEGTVAKAEQKLDEITGKRPANGSYTVRDQRVR